MLHALLHGKLKAHEERLEDLLTSNIFGIAKIFEPSSLLLPFLGGATCPAGGAINLSPAVTEVEYAFWPHVHEPQCRECEPDVQLLMSHADGSRSLVFIEAKLHSGKSSVSTGEPADEEDAGSSDQLAKELENLSRLAKRLNCTRHYLIYLTKHVAPPVRDIAESLTYLPAGTDIYWLSWRSLLLVAEMHSHPLVSADLVRLLRRLDLAGFTGIPSPRAALARTSWRFLADQPTTFTGIEVPTRSFWLSGQWTFTTRRAS